MNHFKFREYLCLLRPYQWYKNLLVFLAIIFSGNILNTAAWQSSLLTFIAFCAASSVNYIINDYNDKEKDRFNPEKKTRPLAAGTISTASALILASTLGGISLLFALSVSPIIMLGIIIFLSVSTLYTHFLKHLPPADIVTIGMLFVIRAVAGALAIKVYISPWLILCPFFLALFLSAAKRYSERAFLKNNDSRPILSFYTPKRNKIIFITSTTGLFGSYTLYSILGPHTSLMYTIPLALLVVVRYYQLIINGSIIARHPQKMYTDGWLVIISLLWIISIAIGLY
ncbi:UbiA prenyltransferase family protein [Candidatus Woesearchaeota archaeon]|nr:UbiA prenyltransferase family protein [Candidatus Woesearchaeota archaeon]